ncbi:TetR/AcrR family transcriptional regulator C-terminal domain-containing protein [Lysinibacter sp. HNR]|uniref:TetR/AcrR family transcriptional regulator C-terminal domain-containing protein n=1 Tax=Lysinibacter sp. HNR TaxID=3031408 RepID=UPI002435A25D|nr:TetR/AcrR family transcriptional regulator C-terminal domain-containing protein [Lysinibacter sp. HNR]WGD38667.1 TetR/AcrR family transcriptional regulator C-terminal domain-containing protein [Lysinibacter sp. HNR]
MENGRRHTRDDVARAALRVLDNYGLPDLTMRRLASDLSVQPSALYWHFPNKQTLLAELADRIVSRVNTIPPDPTLGWAASVRLEALSLRNALLAYRDGAEVVASTLALGLGSSLALDRLTAAITAGNFDRNTARRAATTLLHFALGHVSHEQQQMHYDSLGVLIGNPRTLDSENGDPSTDFEFGVNLLIDGLRLRESASRAPSPQRG